MVGAWVVEGMSERPWREHRGRLLFRLVDRGWATKLSNGVHNTNTLSECSDPNLGLQDIGVDLEEDVACDLLLCGRRSEM